MTTTPSNSNYETRQQALDQGVRWAVNTGAQGGNGAIADAVKAAEQFDAFLAGAPAVRGPRPLAELYDDVQWDDPQWRQEFLIGVTDSVVGGLRSPRLLDAIGNAGETSDFGRALVKGVFNLEATSISGSDDPSTSNAPVTIERTWRLDQSVYEIAPRLTPEFKTRVHEDEIRSKSPVQLEAFMLTLIVEARRTLDDWILGAVRGLLDAVGHTLDPDAWDFLDVDLFPVVPFRFEFVRFAGWRAKEWMEEGGEYWNLWIKGKFGAAVFKPHPEMLDDGGMPTRAQRLADEVLKRAGTDVPGQVQVSGAEAASLIDAGVADPSSVEVVTPDPAGQIAQPGADDPRA